MRELRNEIQQLCKCRTFNFHRHMLRIEYDAMLIIIHIRRILEEPLTVVDRHRNNAVVAACRMIQPPCIALIFPAEQTLRIGCLLRELCRRDRLGILLRLGQINRDIQIAILRRSQPFAILRNTITTDIVRILTEFVDKNRSAFFGLS